MSLTYSRNGVLSLYRQMLRNSLKFANYNFREHAYRRISGEFRLCQSLPPSEAEAKFQWGINQAELVKRQAIISQLYPEERSVAAKVKKVR